MYNTSISALFSFLQGLLKMANRVIKSWWVKHLSWPEKAAKWTRISKHEVTNKFLCAIYGWVNLSLQISLLNGKHAQFVCLKWMSTAYLSDIMQKLSRLYRYLLKPGSSATEKNNCFLHVTTQETPFSISNVQIVRFVA